MANPSIAIYLDTNVYSRPFDDQTQFTIQQEADAFLEIIQAVENKDLTLICSDILMFEVDNILIEEKRARVEDYLGLCAKHVGRSKKILKLGKRIQNDCALRARDALHVSSAILGKADYFLSCDKKVTRAKQTECYAQLSKLYRKEKFFAINPIPFVKKMQKGKL
ncbi:MAG: PIN domain-containing protein [Calditrichaceae bacterium]|nr:PIN domain-containing protein [Calditrichia bacterium]NUQ41693.1 PIN domain-containing protein [Calditrichaceae bacterium]